MLGGAAQKKKKKKKKNEGRAGNVFEVLICGWREIKNGVILSTRDRCELGLFSSFFKFYFSFFCFWARVENRLRLMFGFLTQILHLILLLLFSPFSFIFSYVSSPIKSNKIK